MILFFTFAVMIDMSQSISGSVNYQDFQSNNIQL